MRAAAAALLAMAYLAAAASAAGDGGGCPIPDGARGIEAAEREARALCELFRATSGAGGGGWVRSDGWASQAPVCTWHGVGCEDGSGSVVSLELAGNNLTGPLPASLGALAHLRLLNVSSNCLSGHFAFPTSLGSLETLDLSSNALSGPLVLPVALPGAASRLRVLLVRNNLFSALAAGPSQLPPASVEACDASGNAFSCPLPPWATAQCNASCGSPATATPGCSPPATAGSSHGHAASFNVNFNFNGNTDPSRYLGPPPASPHQELLSQAPARADAAPARPATAVPAGGGGGGGGGGPAGSNFANMGSNFGPMQSNFGPVYLGTTEGTRIDVDNDNNNDNNNNGNEASVEPEAPSSGAAGAAGGGWPSGGGQPGRRQHHRRAAAGGADWPLAQAAQAAQAAQPVGVGRHGLDALTPTDMLQSAASRLEGARHATDSALQTAARLSPALGGQPPAPAAGPAGPDDSNFGSIDSNYAPLASNFAPVYAGDTGHDRVDLDNDNNNDNNNNLNESGGGTLINYNINLNLNGPTNEDTMQAVERIVQGVISAGERIARPEE